MNKDASPHSTSRKLHYILAAWSAVKDYLLLQKDKSPLDDLCASSSFPPTPLAIVVRGRKSSVEGYGRPNRPKWLVLKKKKRYQTSHEALPIHELQIFLFLKYHHLVHSDNDLGDVCMRIQNTTFSLLSLSADQNYI